MLKKLIFLCLLNTYVFAEYDAVFGFSAGVEVFNENMILVDAGVYSGSLIKMKYISIFPNVFADCGININNGPKILYALGASISIKLNKFLFGFGAGYTDDALKFLYEDDPTTHIIDESAGNIIFSSPFLRYAIAYYFYDSMHIELNYNYMTQNKNHKLDLLLGCEFIWSVK